MIQLYGREWTREELLQHVGRIEQIAGIRASQLTDGKGRGMRALDVYTGGGLTFRVLPDRALDISSFRFNDIPLAWESTAGEVHPAFYESDGLGWLRTFGGGLLATCGLDQFGSPNVDRGESFGIHGRIGTTPAQNINTNAYWHDDEYQLEIRGEMRQTRIFGENLLLKRLISTGLGAKKVGITDTVTNDGYVSQPHMMLYHFNFGFPLISSETRLIIPDAETFPRDADAEAGVGEWNRFQPPTAGYREQVFRHRVPSGRVELFSPYARRRLVLEYDAHALPHLFQWKMMGQGTYVCGLEPANTSAIHGRAWAREHNDLPVLEPGETRTYSLTISVKPI